MIKIEKLTKEDKGRTVWYKRFDGWDRGIIKSWNSTFIFVVYPGNNQSKNDHWDRYTAAATDPKDLFFSKDS